MVDQIRTFSKIILKNSIYLYFIHIENFFAEVYWVIYRIRWENKNSGIMGTLNLYEKSQSKAKASHLQHLGASWAQPYHLLFVIRTLYFQQSLNILSFLQILG